MGMYWSCACCMDEEENEEKVDNLETNTTCEDAKLITASFNNSDESKKPLSSRKSVLNFVIQTEKSIDSPDSSRKNSTEVLEEEPGEGNSFDLGQLKFMIRYYSERKEVHLRIISAHELPKPDHGKMDPYISITMIPNKTAKMSTNKKRNTLNPFWNELFIFDGIHENEISNKIIYMVLCDYEKMKKDDVIGELTLPLNSFDPRKGKIFFRDFHPHFGRSGQVGEILVSLEFNFYTDILQLVILKARNLKPMDIGGTSDPYVKVWLYIDDRRVEKRKTSVKTKNLNPNYDKSFTFRIPHDKLRHSFLLIKVMDYDKLSRNDHIGSVLLGSRGRNSGKPELDHYYKMIAGEKSEQWHILKVIRDPDFH